jgi:hypothetical protein
MDQADFLQLLEMLRYGRLGERKRIDELSAQTGIPVSENLEDPDSDRMGQGLGQARELSEVPAEIFGL